jgi:hypothetical protein
MKNIIAQFISDENQVNELVNMTANINRNGMAQLKADLEANAPKLKKLAKTQRYGKISKMIESVAANFPKGKSRSKGTTRQNNPYLNAKKRVVLQLDKETGKVIAEHESVQAAHRATNISDSSICYCCNGKYGFKTAGGFKWAYKDAVVTIPETAPEAAPEA